MSLYEDWMQASAELKKAKQVELELRNRICADLLADKLEGSKTFREDGLVITPTAKLTRSIDREVLESIWEDLTDREKQCVVYKPSLVMTNYKKIEQAGGKLLEAITVKPAQASLKIVPEELA